MDKELEELMNKLTDKLLDNKDNKENIEKAKEKINKILEKNPSCLLFAVPNGSLATGTISDILTLISLLIHQTRKQIDDEMLIHACLLGFTKDSKTGDLDKDMVNLILETLKEHI